MEYEFCSEMKSLFVTHTVCCCLVHQRRHLPCAPRSVSVCDRTPLVTAGLPGGSDKWPRQWLCSAGGRCHGDMWGQPDPAHQCSGQLIAHRILMMCNGAVLGRGEIQTKIKLCVCVYADQL